MIIRDLVFPFGGGGEAFAVMDALDWRVMHCWVCVILRKGRWILSHARTHGDEVGGSKVDGLGGGREGKRGKVGRWMTFFI